MFDVTILSDLIQQQIVIPVWVLLLFLVRFYEGVVELSLTAAEKKDPQGLGLHFYKNGEPEEDLVGLQAFQERQVFIISPYHCMECFV